MERDRPRSRHAVLVSDAAAGQQRRSRSTRSAFSPDGKCRWPRRAPGGVVKLWDIPGLRRVRLPLGAPLLGPQNTIYSVRSARTAATSPRPARRHGPAVERDRPGLRAAAQAGALTGADRVRTRPRRVLRRTGGLLAAGSAGTLVAGATTTPSAVWNVADRARPAAAARHAADRDRPARSPGWRSARTGGLLAASSQDYKVWLWRIYAPAGRRSDGTLTGSIELGEHGRVQPGRPATLAAGHVRSANVLVWNTGHPAALTATHAAPAAGHVGDLGRPRPGGGGRRRRNRLAMGASVPGARSPATRPTSARLRAGRRDAGRRRRPASSSGQPPAGRCSPSHPLPRADVRQRASRSARPSRRALLAVASTATARSQLLDARHAGAGRASRSRPPAGPAPSNRWRTARTARRSPPAPTTGPCGSGRVTDPAHPRQLSRRCPTPATSVYTIVFAPNGRTLAAASVRPTSPELWNVADPRRARSARRGRLGGMARLRDRPGLLPQQPACSRSAAQDEHRPPVERSRARRTARPRSAPRSPGRPGIRLGGGVQPGRARRWPSASPTAASGCGTSPIPPTRP